MRTLITATLFVLSSSLFAMPTVGDMATYKVKVAGMEMTTMVELISFNEAAQTFEQKSTNMVMDVVMGEPEVKTVKMEDLMTDGSVGIIMMLCESEQLKGKYETVSLVAGNVDTCAITNEQGLEFSVGSVPFGIVKFKSSEMEMELVSFKSAL